MKRRFTLLDFSLICIIGIIIGLITKIYITYDTIEPTTLLGLCFDTIVSGVWLTCLCITRSEEKRLKAFNEEI